MAEMSSTDYQMMIDEDTINRISSISLVDLVQILEKRIDRLLTQYNQLLQKNADLEHQNRMLRHDLGKIHLEFGGMK